MRKPKIAIRLKADDYEQLVSLTRRIVTDMTANPNFPVPLVPLLLLKAAADEVVTGLGAWRPLDNRGSDEDLHYLRLKSLIVLNLLEAQAWYVMATATLAAVTDYETMASIMTSSGFALKNEPVPQGVLEMVQGLHHFVSRSIRPNQVKLKWFKPENVSNSNNVHGYRVMRADSFNIAEAQQVAIITSTSFIDTNNSVGVQQRRTYWIIPFNNNGDGVPSDGLTVVIPGL